MVGGIVMNIEEKVKEYRSNVFGTQFSNVKIHLILSNYTKEDKTYIKHRL